MSKALDGDARTRRGLTRSLELAETKLRAIRDNLEAGQPDQTLHMAKSLLSDVGDIVGWADSWETLHDVRNGVLLNPATPLTASAAQVDVDVLHAAMRIAREMRRQPDRLWNTSEFRPFATTVDPCGPVIDAALSLLLNNSEVTLPSDSEGLWQWDGKD
jgi:hypothetical protein